MTLNATTNTNKTDHAAALGLVLFIDETTKKGYMASVEENDKDYARLLKTGNRLCRKGVTQWINCREVVKNGKPIFAKDGNRIAHDRTLVTIAKDGTRTEEVLRRVYKLGDWD